LGVTAGTATANKAVVLGASKEIATITTATITNLDVGASGSVGSIDVFPSTATRGKLSVTCANQTGDTTVTLNANAMGQATQVNLADPGVATSYVGQSTAALTLAEMDLLDLSSQTSTITVAGAVSVTKRITNLNATSGAYAITLAAPDATMLGQIKVIQMTVDGNAITMALTEVIGQSGGNSASFDAVNETLVLVAGTNKWIVLKEVGVTLS